MDTERGLTDANTIPEGEHPLLAGRYRVVRRLGAGGMGEVFLVEDGKLDGRRFAVKMLPSFLSGNRRAMVSLKREALHAMELSHTNIVTVRGFEETEAGQPFLVMDFIEGRTLEDVLVDAERLPADEVVRLFTPIAEALDLAHARGVVHRDVKPSNIMIRSDGTPVIMDFGVAREVKETSTMVTGQETASGTLPYMSPEQLRGERPSPAQDVYSLAATMWECLMGEPPFCRGDIRHQILHEPPRSLPDVGGDLAVGLAKGLAKDPGDRPGTARALVSRAGASATEARAVAAPESKDDRSPMPSSAVDLLELESEAREAMRGIEALLEKHPGLEGGFETRVARARDFLESARENKQASMFEAAAIALRKAGEECEAVREAVAGALVEEESRRREAEEAKEKAEKRHRQIVDQLDATMGRVIESGSQLWRELERRGLNTASSWTEFSREVRAARAEIARLRQRGDAEEALEAARALARRVDAAAAETQAGQGGRGRWFGTRGRS